MLGRFERNRRKSASAYVEIDDMYQTNVIIDAIKEYGDRKVICRVQAAKSGQSGHLGLQLFFETQQNFDLHELLTIEHIVFVEEE